MSQNFDRRWLLRSALSSGLFLAGCQSLPAGRTRFDAYPFTLGVASGDPLADGFVLWTRLAPAPFEDDVLQGDIAVGWEVSETEDFSRIAQSGRALARPAMAHSVHVEVGGLRAGRDYFYRFHTGDAVSPTGRTRTSPFIGSPLDRLRFAVASCQSYSVGYYGAYRDMAEQAPDLILHVGDYIYETPWTMPVRRMPAPEANDLKSYRAYHAAVKTDPHLQAAHAVAPWLVIWDDHEVLNDYRDGHTPEGHTATSWAARRRAAYQAYYEHMPIRRRARPGPDGAMQLYQRAVFGDLAQFDLLDTRQYRSDHPCRGPGGETPGWVTCDASDPARTMLGEPQETWLGRGFGVSGAAWNFITQTTQMTSYLRTIEGAPHYSSDRWTAYPAARARLFDLVKSKGLPGTVFLGGDIHAFYASGLSDVPGAEPFASELVVGAISSGGGGDQRHAAESDFYQSLGHPFYFENRHNGYLLCDLSRDRLDASIRIVDSVLDPVAITHPRHQLTIDRRRPGLA
nr:alkaline phosphatase D family protein [uncultured Hyphomonas sp.]